MRSSKLVVLLTSLLTLAGAHCGGQTSSNGNGDGGGGGGPGGPGGGGPVYAGDAGAVEHLPTGLPTTCDLPRGAGSFQTSTDAGVVTLPNCLQDADCSQGANGRCNYMSGNASHNVGICTFDECASDAACGSGRACFCRTVDSRAVANICIEADCKSDSECPSGLCAKSVERSSCDRPISYHCRTPSDECAVDSDCMTQSFGSCEFSSMKGHFSCNYSICSG